MSTPASRKEIDAKSIAAACTDIDADRDVCKGLIGAGVHLRRRPEAHDQFFAAYGKFGSSNAYRVCTGSQNGSGRALSGNDELFVELGAEAGETHPIFDAYYDHSDDAFDRGVQCTKSNWPCTRA